VDSCHCSIELKKPGQPLGFSWLVVFRKASTLRTSITGHYSEWETNKVPSMSDQQYETRCVTLVSVSGGCSKITSDGLMANGEFSDQQIKQDLDELYNQGWVLVSTISHRVQMGILQSMDLYYRRVIQPA
jgi:hypothetical protein